jgi:tetratricopeptide (TPR) repeat protein
VRPPGRIRNSIEIVSDPAEIFFAYSSEFSNFLEQVFRETSLLEIDGRRLEEMGVGYQSRDDFERAGFCFEAALQIENDPAVRWDLLNRLLPCYQKTGQAEAAGKILAFMAKIDFNERRLYRVLPERGF